MASDGSDSNSGLSPCSPWQTTAKVDATVFSPGAVIAFEGGDTFSTPLSPWAGTSGTASAPVTYTSYGSGQANLASSIYLQSASNLIISNLNISSSGSRGIGTSSTGTGVTNVVVENDEVTSSYDAGEGGYGIGLGNTADSNWTITNDIISNTADSGIMSVGPNITVIDSTFSDDGIGSHCGDDPATGWASTTYNPCHAVYAKSSNWTIENNVITNSSATTAPATFSAITLRGHDNTVSGNTISGPGSGNGISFWSETTTAGTTDITDNVISNELDTGIETGAGTEPIVESFVIDGNSISGIGSYDGFFYPPLSASATLTLGGNTFNAASSGAYINIANAPSTPPPRLTNSASIPYTGLTYREGNNYFLGSSLIAPWFIAGQGYDWSDYVAYFGSDNVGINDIEQAGTKTIPLVFPPPGFGGGSSKPGLTTNPSPMTAIEQLLPVRGHKRKWKLSAKLKNVPTAAGAGAGAIAGYVITYAWRINGNVVSRDRAFKHIFSKVGAKYRVSLSVQARARAPTTTTRTQTATAIGAEKTAGSTTVITLRPKTRVPRSASGLFTP